MPHVLAVADDLSGAAEAAAELAGVPLHGEAALRRAVVQLALDLGPDWDGAEIVVLDAHSRGLSAARLRDTVEVAHRILSGSPSALRFKKIDSQLRGSTGAELQEWSRHGPVAIAPALPSLGRVVVDGTLHLPATASGPARTVPVVGLTAGRRAELVPLDAVERGVGSVVDALERASASGGTLVVDATTDAHLDVLAAALLAVPAVLPAGSGGLAAAFGRAVGGRRPAPFESPQPVRAERRIAVVAGSIDPALPPQLEHLRRLGIPVHVLGGDDLDPGTWRRDLEAGCAVFAVAPDRPLAADPLASASALVDRLRPHLQEGDVDLVLTGGETARRMLDRLGETVLRPRRRVHGGAVVSLTGSGRLVATRPGSFGGTDSLAAMIAVIRAERRDRITTPLGSEHHA